MELFMEVIKCLVVSGGQGLWWWEGDLNYVLSVQLYKSTHLLITICAFPLLHSLSHILFLLSIFCKARSYSWIKGMCGIYIKTFGIHKKCHSFTHSFKGKLKRKREFSHSVYNYTSLYAVITKDIWVLKVPVSIRVGWLKEFVLIQKVF